MRTIGVIGGLGQYACIHFERRLAILFSNSSHQMPSMIVVNPSLDKCYTLDTNEVQAYCERCVLFFQNIGVELCVIVCNTFSNATSGRCMNPIDATTKMLNTRRIRKLVFIGTPTAAQLYRSRLRVGIEMVRVNERITKKFIRAVEQGNAASVHDEFHALLASIQSTIIIGCTELSIFEAETLHSHVFDSTECLLRELMTLL